MSTTELNEPGPAHPAAGVSPDDQLPPVAAPSAGFVVQLFVIPALIVAIIFAIGWAVKWLADRGADPGAYVAALKRNNDGRWQAAHDLADVLRNRRNQHLKDDPQLAAQLVEVLEGELESGGSDEHAVELRIYLCNALGEFRVAQVVDCLVKAATLARDENEAGVQIAAVKALAVHMSMVPPARRAGGSSWDRGRPLGRGPSLLSALIAASRDERPLMRSTAAFALAAHGGDEAERRLAGMLDDGCADVRYNAATMLAAQGNVGAVSTLAEMLDPAETLAVEAEEQGARDYKRQLILVNALRAARELAAKNPAADLAPLRAAVDRLTHDDQTPRVRTDAQALMNEVYH